MKVLKRHKSFSGWVEFCEHDSQETQTKMKFSMFRPSQPPKGCLIWLSGMTCTEENFIMKAGSQKYLNEHQLMVVCPDTSPRGLNLPNENLSYDFGTGAGFYVDAQTEGYRDHYRMYSYISKELYSWIEFEFSMKHKISIFGHSMGGHGALIMGLREPEKFQSVSAFAPITTPTGSEWGRKILEGYLGSDQKMWNLYDACQLLEAGHRHPNPILIDQGLLDEVLHNHLLPEEFEKTCRRLKQPFELNYRDEYDHSYYFVATFIESHIQFHGKYLL